MQLSIGFENVPNNIMIYEMHYYDLFVVAAEIDQCRCDYTEGTHENTITWIVVRRGNKYGVSSTLSSGTHKENKQLLFK